MVWHYLAELLPPKCSLLPLRTKIVIPLRSSFWEICFPPAESGHVEDTMKRLSKHFDQSPVSQPMKFLNQQIVIDYICMKIIHNNKSIAKSD